MKATKFAVTALVASLVLATSVNATSIGRSGGSSSHSSPSVSRSSGSTHSAPAPAPKAPSVAPAPAKPGGIGGTQGSVGVRKSEVTQPVAQQTKPTTPAPTSTGAGAPAAPVYSTAPSYSSPAPAPQVSGSSVFWNSLGGSFVGNMLGNALFGNHNNSGGTTVINNGGSAGVPNSGVVSTGPSAGTADAQFNPGGLPVQAKKEYTMWNFIGDAITFVILIAVLVGIAWIFYKGFQMIRGYVRKERGVSNIPFNPTQRFWEIQKAFAAADVASLSSLLGPDVVDELTNGLTASTLTLHNVSHEVRLANNTEFSIWYKFEDGGTEVNQVWHYEKFGSEWKLNGIENV